MMKLPCDDCVWNLIPMIKRELVLKLYKEQGLSMTEIARTLDVTKGSVTQYVQGKRAGNSKKLRKYKGADNMISKLAADLARKKMTNKAIALRFCQICKKGQLALCKP